MGWLASLLDDVRYTCRTLRHNRTLAFGTVLTLAPGIGVNTAVFSVVNALVLRLLPVSGGERLVVVGSRTPGTTLPGPMSFADLQDYRTATRDVLDDIAGYSVGFIGLAPDHKRPARVLATWVTGNYFALLGIQPALGRLIHSAEGAPGRIDPVVVLGHATWRQRFNGDPSIVGKTVRLNGRVCTIVGVVPPWFAGTFAFSESEVYLPITWTPGFLHEDRGGRILHTLARLRSGATLQQAQAVADLVAGRLAQEHPATNAVHLRQGSGGQVGVTVLPERLAPRKRATQSNQYVAAAPRRCSGVCCSVWRRPIGSRSSLPSWV